MSDSGIEGLGPPPLSRFVEGLVSVSRDYRDWLASPRPLPAVSGLRVTLASKTFDVSSRFAIVKLRTDVLSSVVEGLEASSPECGRVSGSGHIRE